MIDPGLLDQIYETAAFPERLPSLLQDIADRHGARGALLFHSPKGGSAISISPGAEHLLERYIGEGYMQTNERGSPLFAEHAPCFRTDSDFRTLKEQEAMPVYRDLLIPTGFAIGAGTVIQGTNDDAIALTLEGFASEAAVRRQLPLLDLLRPHIARATSLAVRMRLIQSDAAVQALDLVGTSAAIIAPSGRLRSMNAGFADRMGNRCYERGGKLRFRSPLLSSRIDRAIAAAQLDGRPSATLVTPADDTTDSYALHVIPLRNAARDRFDSNGLLLILADPRNRAAPQAGMLRLLFDLTPAEAMLAAELAAGHPLRDAATRRGIAYSTARVYLRQIFAKTGCHRQSELMTLLAGSALAGRSPD